MSERTNLEHETTQKKPYVKPEVVKHTAAALVVGSDDDGCNRYASRTNKGGDYYY